MEWLQELCRENDIVFIDPTTEFFTAANQGKKLYGDHFTADGHRAFASAFNHWYISKYKQ